MDLRDLDFVQFGIYSAEEIMKNSVCEVYNMKLTGPNSVYDERMGVMEPNKKCVTCGLTDKRCVGHFGHINLNIDVLHPLFTKLTIMILKCICYKCSRLLLMRKQLELNNILKFHRQNRFNKIVEKMDKIDYCTHCETIQPKYLYCTQDKHFYMNFKLDGENTRMQMYESEIRKIFDNVIEEDIVLMGFDPHHFHPKNLVLSVLPVIPPVARPFIIADNVTCDDDLTIQYQEIVKANFHIGDANTPDSKRTKFVHSLKFRIKSLFDNSGDRQKVSNGRPLKGIKKRLTGKEGLIRNNLMGKRVDKSARTVIGPDPTLRVDEIAIPEEIANILCYSVRVNDYNIESLRDLIKKNQVNFVLRDDGNIRINIKYATMKQGTRLQYGDMIVGKTIRMVKKEQDLFSLQPGEKVFRNGVQLKNLVCNSFRDFDLRVGDVVERKLQDGDILLLNRQPTLHRGSMIAQKIRIRPGKTIRLNLAITKSFNADFDGDEMNLHCPASCETECELRELSSLSQNIISHQSSKANIVIVQDALLGAYLMTKEKCPLLSRKTFFQIANSIEHLDLKVMDKKMRLYRKMKQKEPWYYDGKMLFSLLLPDDFFLRDHNKIDRHAPELVIEQGILLRGAIGKPNLSSGSNSLITLFYHEYGETSAMRFINNVQFLANAFLSYHGFSIGIDDCKVTKKEEIQKNISKAFIKAMSIEENVLDPNIREAYILYALSGARDTGMLIAQKALKEDNNFLATVVSGAKGDYFNIAQITGLLGQQNLNGERIKPLLTNYQRTLPHYPIESKDYDEDMRYESMGFIRNSFIQGLNPREYFFHAMTGREGITDTAMKSVTGDTLLLLHENGRTFMITIGEWVDHHIHLGRIQKDAHLNMETVHLPQETWVPTTDEHGNVTWALVTSATRHDPGEVLYMVKTRSGKKVVVTESKSLLIWDPVFSAYTEKPTPMVRIGDLMPSCAFLPARKEKGTRENTGFLDFVCEATPTELVGYLQRSLQEKEHRFHAECLSMSFANKPQLYSWGYLFNRLGVFGNMEEDGVFTLRITQPWLSKVLILLGKDEPTDVSVSSDSTLMGDTLMDPIVEIEKIIPDVGQKVYDLTVPVTLNFGLANGLMVRDTATSGYIQRRMIKIAEDIQVKYDGTVRNSANSIIQMAYGDNFLDPMHTLFRNHHPTSCNIKRMIEKLNHKHAKK